MKCLYFFVSYIWSVFEQVFWGYCPKNLDIVVKTAFQVFDERMFLRKLQSSKNVRNFDVILSPGFSRLHSTLLHEKFIEKFFFKKLYNFQKFCTFLIQNVPSFLWVFLCGNVKTALYVSRGICWADICLEKFLELNVLSDFQRKLI